MYAAFLKVFIDAMSYPIVPLFYAMSVICSGVASGRRPWERINTLSSE